MKLTNLEVHIGNGKGKTTASIGEGIVALGSGLKVCMIQFLKDNKSSEIHVLNKFENFDIFHFESPKNFYYLLNNDEKSLLKTETDNAIRFFKNLISENKYDLIILDEVLNSIDNDLVDTNKLIEYLSKKKDSTRVILTGRNIPEELKYISSSITEFKCIKHPYENNIPARKGIEY